MKKEHIFSTIGLVILWQIFAIVLNNDILLPSIIKVLSSFITLLKTKVFYISILYSLRRVIIAYIIAGVIATVIALLSERFIIFRNLFEPLNILSKSIPNISYIIITLIWLGQEKSVILIVFLILFPMFYNSFMEGFDKEPSELKDIEKIYPETFLETVRLKSLPLLLDNILRTSKTALGMGLRVCVMAEILGQVKIGIGKQLYYARLYLDTPALITWTIVIILLSAFIDKVFNTLIKNKEEKECKS